MPARRRRYTRPRATRRRSLCAGTASDELLRRAGGQRRLRWGRRRPGRRGVGARCSAGAARHELRGDPDHARALRPRRRGRRPCRRDRCARLHARGRARPPRALLGVRARRDARAATHARPPARGRRDDRCRRPTVRLRLDSRALARPHRLLRSRAPVQRRPPLRRLGRSRRPPWRRLGHPARLGPGAHRPVSAGDDRLPRPRAADDARRRARAEPLPRGAARVTRIEAPRGTHDVLPSDQPLWQKVTGEMERLCALYGYRRIQTPGFEDTELFQRTSGAGSDIVQKEMYTFEDRGGRSLTLRPEGTAPICRAYIEHGMHREPQPVKLWYTGPMFRYEAPQAGRFRQHSQVGAEVIGSEDPAVDAELIDLLASLYAQLGLTGVRLAVSSIGDADARRAYAVELRDFLLGSDVFDADQRARIDVNPLRAFDWEGDEIRAVTEQAPKIIDRLSERDR